MCITPRKAATVSIIRDNSGTIEVLLMRRHLDDRFLPDYYVFPGGAVDQQDYDYDFSAGFHADCLKDFDGSSKKYFGYIICGIRETFEESGMLFAVDENGNYPVINTVETIEKFSFYRKAVFEKKISFRGMLEKEKLIPAVEKFYYMNRWVTPPLSHIRYDARFFAALAPDNQAISHDGDELVDFQWLSPQSALDQYNKGKIKLVMPTIKTLEFLNKYNSAAGLIEYFHC